MRFSEINNLNRTECLDELVKKVSEISNCGEVLYLRYVELAQSLIVDRGMGWSVSELKNVGVDLTETDINFTEHDLLRPTALRGLAELATEGLNRKYLLGFPLLSGKEVRGVLLLLSNQIFNFNEQTIEQIELQLHLVGARIRELDLLSTLDQSIVPDPVTGLYTRPVLINKVNVEISRARRIQKPVSLLKMKISNYYDFSLAHSKRDIEISLRALAKQLVQSFRNTDLIVRWSEDEFYVLLPHTDVVNAQIKAESILDLVYRMDFSKVLNEEARLKLCVGISEYPRLCSDAQDLLRSADSAMNGALKNRSHKLVVAEPSKSFQPDFSTEANF